MLGMAIGDDAVPVLATGKCRPSVPRSAPRPQAALFPTWVSITTKRDILWVDYDGADVHASGGDEQATKQPPGAFSHTNASDNRISYGCINVPVKFFNNVLKPILYRKDRCCLCAAGSQVEKRDFCISITTSK
ncbi:MAG: hypothetical protein MZV70_19845 [Desulfobacterales bacterium]|nr:hypothetical protein [Desulfobacterales bacterium]